MTHDPMCSFQVPTSYCKECELIARVREDERFYALRDAVHTVEQMLDEYPYDSEGYRAITTAGNRLRILAGSKDD